MGTTTGLISIGIEEVECIGLSLSFADFHMLLLSSHFYYCLHEADG